jgi:16S rRNA (guanine966-N2)-methyltransferase
MRVIAGTFRSRPLKSLKGLALRPTSERLRETLFNILAPQIEGSRFIDAFAGTGAVGIEAISRGASDVLFIENHPLTATLIQKNLDLLEIHSNAKILTMDALRALQRLAATHKSTTAPFDIVFLDPPYAAAEQYHRVLSFLGDAPFLHPGSIVIAEHRHTFELPEKFGHLTPYRLLRQGDASLTFFHFTAPAQEGPEGLE